MKWCCDGFRLRHAQRHERGLIIYVLPPIDGASSEPSFHIGFRAVERSRHASLTEAIKGRINGCVALGSSMGMKYCPWCGATLTTHYRKSWEMLIDEKITDEFKWPVA